MKSSWQVVTAVAVAVVLTLGASTGRAQTGEEAARRLYESGLAFAQQQKYAEAMKDFENVVSSFGTSAVADDAMLQMAMYQLDVARDPATSKSTAESLLKKYPASDSAAMAYIVIGRGVMDMDRSSSEIDTALASFERVPRLFPRSDAVPIALFYSGEALRFGGRLDVALNRYRELSLQYPRSIWSARAALGSALCLAYLGNGADAFSELQRVRLRFPDTPEAAKALAWNTVLYRLHLRGAPAYAFSGKTIAGAAGKLKDVVALAVGEDGNLVVLTRQATLTYRPEGTLVHSTPVLSPRDVLITPDGVVTLQKTGLKTEAKFAVFTVPKPDGTPKLLEDLAAAVRVSTGEIVVADHDSKTLLKFTAAGKPLGKFAPLRADRLAINALDEIAALDRDAKTVTTFDRTGKSLRTIAEHGTGYQMKDPQDIAFDELGHLFLLDRAGTVFVFDRPGKLLTSYSVPEKTPGSFHGGTAVAVDGSARLYIYDNHFERVQIHQ